MSSNDSMKSKFILKKYRSVQSLTLFFIELMARGTVSMEGGDLKGVKKILNEGLPKRTGASYIYLCNPQ